MTSSHLTHHTTKKLDHIKTKSSSSSSSSSSTFSSSLCIENPSISST
eukprot:CAMPEP_0183730006 /NCGR_PEP_ID=MMETSP0737-20130205/31736_1 /TAXON_ID=385413 /ORGANISM="Thalassiosira miniscula, Strain CCMP1093" /LENGTH=46 /DNA_ID= /DNA_START= /DNA_END= /DNA_ORIENTATION=